MTSRRLILCADDYGISPAVSGGIRELAALGRLSATGVMSCMPSWAEEAPLLKALDGSLAIGLHFTLTDQRPLSAPGGLAPEGRLPAIRSLVIDSFAGRLDRSEIEIELDRQIDAFERHLGRLPDFLDGHQHVHILPTIRDAVIGAFGRRLDPAKCWLRSCRDRPIRLLRRPGTAKAGIIAALARGFDEQARSRGIRLNRGFSGFYDCARQSLADKFVPMLAGAGDQHLMMVHPGHVDAVLEACDSLTAPREHEWSFLRSEAFSLKLAAAGFVLAGAAWS